MGPASAALMLEIRTLARIDVARRTRMELLPRFRARFLDAVSSEFSWRRWTARSACSIKYAFIVFDADGVAQISYVTRIRILSL